LLTQYGYSQIDVVYNNLVWSDEFNTNGSLDVNKWFHQTQIPAGGNWYNNEVQHYTNRTTNSFVDGGNLHIVAKKETFTDQNVTKQYTSARLNSKFAFKYGRVDIRAKVPNGQGTWPALWLLGKNVNEDGGFFDANFGTTGWPACGEIDIMEHVGYEPDIVHFSIHNKAFNSGLKNEKTTKLKVKKSSISFHIYRLDWTPYGIRGFVDGKKYFEYKNTGKGSKYWPFDKKFFLIINLAIGGDWGGINGIDNSIFPATMEIDYVRVYNFIE